MVRCVAQLVGFIAVLLVVGLAAPAQATERDLGDLLVERASDFSNEFGLRVGELTGHVVDMRFDWRNLKARLRLGGSDSHFDCQGVVK